MRPARQEAAIARGLGYCAGLLSLGAMKGASIDELIEHCTVVAREMPLFGFYLQEAVGGLPLPAEFWRRKGPETSTMLIQPKPLG